MDEKIGYFHTDFSFALLWVVQMFHSICYSRDVPCWRTLSMGMVTTAISAANADSAFITFLNIHSSQILQHVQLMQ